MNMIKKVTIVIPSYNRADILEKTIPTYLQPEVGEVIVVDDCSTDNTKQVVAQLMLNYPQIKYLRNEVNSKQGFTKNRGIEVAQFEYIYFGDDDSYIVPGTIARLLYTMQKYNAEIVGAQAVYSENPEINFNINEHIEQRMATDVKQIIDMETLAVDFSLAYPIPVEVPFVQACFIVPTKLAKQIMFDTNYKGNAYREETDFIIRAALNGAKIIYDSSVVQINLPRVMSKGGAHAGTPAQWYSSAIENNNYFLDKNYAAMQAKWSLPHSVDKMKEIFASEMKNRYKAERKYDWIKIIGLYKPLKYIKNLIK